MGKAKHANTESCFITEKLIEDHRNEIFSESDEKFGRVELTSDEDLGVLVGVDDAAVAARLEAVEAVG